jgi:hypothetical protein
LGYKIDVAKSVEATDSVGFVSASAFAKLSLRFEGYFSLAKIKNAGKGAGATEETAVSM